MAKKDKKDTTIGLRCTKKQKEKIAKEAAKEDTSISDYILNHINFAKDKPSQTEQKLQANIYSCITLLQEAQNILERNNIKEIYFQREIDELWDTINQ